MGCAVNTSSTLVAEMVASQGYDFVMVDAQHSAIDAENLRSIMQAVKAGGSRSIVRVGGHMDRTGMQQALDLGAAGVLIPCGREVADIQYAVSCCKYPTRGPGSAAGTRSIYVNLRSQFPGGFGNLFSSVLRHANEETLVACQIETREALENVEAIAAIDGLDMLFIGPGDLAADLGLMREHGAPACWQTEAFAAAQRRVAKACLDAGKVAGYWNSDVAKLGALGFRFFVVDGDITAMQAALSKSLREKREIVAGLRRGD